MAALGVEFSSIQCSELFRLLDHDMDGWISNTDWYKVVQQDGNPNLTRIRSLIKQRKLGREGVMRAMNIDSERPNLGILELKEALLAFDRSVTDHQALGMARYILMSSETISLVQLWQVLECMEEEDVKVCNAG
jgi:hypothetical protein